MNKGLSIVQKCMSDTSNNNSFGMGLTANNEVRKRIFYMTYDIFFLLLKGWYSC